MQTLVPYHARAAIILSDNYKSEFKVKRELVRPALDEYSYCLDAPEMIPSGSTRNRFDGPSIRFFLRPDSEY